MIFAIRLVALREKQVIFAMWPVALREWRVTLLIGLRPCEKSE